MTLTDSFKHKGLRQQMVDRLRQHGISDENVLRAMNEVPRHCFLDTALDAHAYDDRALNIGCGQTISHPSTVAMQSQLLSLSPGMKVLEIGTGSGYQAAVLSRMGAKVFSIERQKSLYEHTRRLLSDMNFRVRCFLGDGYRGLADFNYGPYDRIIVTCGAPQIPHTLMAQLKIGGIMVIPIDAPSPLPSPAASSSDVRQQEMLRIVKQGDEPCLWAVEKFGTYSFVPMLDGRNMSLS